MILDNARKEKRVFSVDNKKDVAVFVEFMKTGAWGVGGCPFHLQFPYLTVPDMIRDKLLRKFLKLDK
jgi:hypothetical protein